MMITVGPAIIDAPSELKAFQDRSTGAGAIVSFSGLVRENAETAKVRTLHLQAYEPMTSDAINKAATKAQSRWSLTGLRICHRTGDIAPGETIVFVAAAAAHRRAAFEAADFLMDYLKTEAIFWKKEITDQGEAWIEPRGEDHKDRARWTPEK